ncbi:MAG: DNA adenine methylase [Synergistaceae bacterium]
MEKAFQNFNKMKSPIKYYGGKGGMFNHILDRFPSDFGKETRTANDGSADIYMEPFGGSATVLFKKKPSPIEIYNDLDHNVYSLFKVLSDDDLFKKFKDKCALSYYSREIFREFVLSLRTEKMDILERAFRFFYVNRVAYNGVGGFSCNVSAVRRGMSKSVSDMLSTIDYLPEVHTRLKSVIIENRDAIELIKKYDKSTALFYLDPPYHHSTRTTARYDIDMTNEKQEELVETLLNLKYARVLMSGYVCNLYSKLERDGWKRVDLEIKTQTAKREKKTKVESLWLNYDI